MTSAITVELINLGHLMENQLAINVVNSILYQNCVTGVTDYIDLVKSVSHDMDQIVIIINLVDVLRGDVAKVVERSTSQMVNVVETL